MNNKFFEIKRESKNNIKALYIIFKWPYWYKEYPAISFDGFEHYSVLSGIICFYRFGNKFKVKISRCKVAKPNTQRVSLEYLNKVLKEIV